MTSRESRLREACRGLLREIDPRTPLDIDELVQQIADYRGHPIRSAARDIPANGPFGAVAMTHTAEWLVHQQATSPSHRAHILTHELAHLLADELAARAGIAPAPAREPLRAEETPEGELLLDGRDLVGDQRVGGYDNLREHDAEVVASAMHEWASVLDAVEGAPSAGEARSLDTALTDPLGWR